METGCVHLYTGDGKGKTTAAVGLCTRAVGNGLRVAFLQFLKNGQTGEIASLEKLGVTVYSPKRGKFLWDMDAAEREEAQKQQEKTLAQARLFAKDYDLLVLDEAIAAMDSGMLSAESLVSFLLDKPKGLEVVLTGRGDCETLLPFADYVTEMRALAHPFEKRALKARPGIEY